MLKHPAVLRVWAAFFLTLSVDPAWLPKLARSQTDNSTDPPMAQQVIRDYIANACLDCHEGSAAEAGLDLSQLALTLETRTGYDLWVQIHDRVRDGEMPPPDDGRPRRVAAVGWSSGAATRRMLQADRHDQVDPSARAFLVALASQLVERDRESIAAHGRSSVRRQNRLEYENSLREILDAPWLMIADDLPEDGVEDLFNKSGERLDVSHVQMSQFLSVADKSIRTAVNAAAFPPQRHRYYAREEPTHQGYLHYRFGQTAATRSIVPLLGLHSEPEVIRKNQPVTVGESDPETRELEAMGVFSGVYSATTKYDFTRIDPPIDGRYRVRIRTYTFRAGPGGASGGDDHGLTGGKRQWWRPDRNNILPGNRDEPITLYALATSGDSRWLATFDSKPEPTVFETVVNLRAGEGIRPDAARLVRTRPGWSGNPNATPEGVPGFAMNWLEVEGPLTDCWPPASYRAVFGDLPLRVTQDKEVKAIPRGTEDEVRKILRRFQRRAIGESAGSVEPYVGIFNTAREMNFDFTDAMIASLSAMLASPEFLYFDYPSGRLSPAHFEQRLSYFLWNGPLGHQTADQALRAAIRSAKLDEDRVVKKMLADPRSGRFVNAFLDYWLDLRDLNANTPDAELYPEYYLDELLTESSLLETRRFFREMIDEDLPADYLVDSDFIFANQRLAEHYGIAKVDGVGLRRVDLKPTSPRGGLLTQASVLRITSNGTTTSPVVRGAWFSERLLGVHIPPPPSGVDAVEPDIRGAMTIRQQLEMHRESESCNACHAKFDPTGLALEAFDVAGGWRTRYRAVGDAGEPVEGFGKNGHAFKYKLALPVDCSGELRSGEAYADVQDIRKLLLTDRRRLARNLLNRFITYATGASVRFGDRADVEQMLDQAEPKNYGVRSLLLALIHSEMFARK